MIAVDTDDVTEESVEASEDGRHVRRERNRDAVVDALLALYHEGNLAPNSDEIAARAGLSPRSLFRYFDDIDDLTRAALQRQYNILRPLFRIEAPPQAPLVERISALVAQRTRLFEAIGPAGYVSRNRASFQSVIQVHLATSRRNLRLQVQHLLESELASLPKAAATTRLAAIDVLCSFESYQLMRHDQGLSIDQTTDALTELLRSSAHS